MDAPSPSSAAPGDGGVTPQQGDGRPPADSDGAAAAPQPQGNGQQHMQQPLEQERSPLEERLEALLGRAGDLAKARSALQWISSVLTKGQSSAKARSLRASNFVVKKHVDGVPGMDDVCALLGFERVQRSKKEYLEVPDGHWDAGRASAGVAAVQAALERLDATVEEQKRDDGPRNKCKGACGLYGSAQWGGYCSQCYRHANGIAAPLASTRSGECEREGCHNFAAAPRPLCNECNAKYNRPRTWRDKWQSARRKALAVVRFRLVVPEKPVQKNTGRCWACSKKMGIAPQCRCGYYFCPAHRFPPEHNCRYDYVRQQQQRLVRENPTLKKDKFDKL